jgi:ribosomal protein L32
MTGRIVVNISEPSKWLLTLAAMTQIQPSRTTKSRRRMPKTAVRSTLVNAAVCRKCGDRIESKHRHDFVTCKCGAISLDGGNDYVRGVGNPKDFLPA